MCKKLLGIIPETKKRAKLILEDGTVFEGYSFGADVSVGGEVGELFSEFFFLFYEF